MSTKVIQLLNKINHSLLHRGLEGDTSNPYIYNRSHLKKENRRKLPWTLVSTDSHSRCSRTFDHEIGGARKVRLIGASSMALFALIAIMAVAPIIPKLDTAEAIDGNPSSTTITITKAAADLTIAATSADGTFASSEGNQMAQFKVGTSNYTGYTLTIAASDDNQTLVNTDTSITEHNTFSTITSVIDEKTFDSSTYNGQWGYKPSKMKSVENVGFWPSPTTTATTLDTTESANPGEGNENNYTIALGARADYAQATGTYSKTMTLSAVANPANYSITYTDNTGDTSVKNIPDISTSTTSGTEITLSTVTPSRTGYVFKGWCDEAPTSSGTVCNGNTYTASGTYPIDQTTANVITLYATWEIPQYDIMIKPSTGVSSVSLNGTSCSNASGCVVSDLTYGQSYTLTATMNDGYSFAAWSPQGAGTVANITSSSTNFTIGEGEATITAVAAGADAQAVTVNFAAAGSGTVGISNVVFKETATGTTVGTVSTSGGTVKLNPGIGYTITTNTSGIYGISTYNGGTAPYALNNASYGTLTSTTGNPTYFTPNASSSNAVITVTSCIHSISGTMQTYATASNQLCDDATGSLTDSRDNQIYTVGVVKANNGGTTKLWMTRNLAVGCNGSGSTYGAGRRTISLNNGNSNVSTSWSTSSAGELAGNTSSNSYTAPFMTCNATYGAWYNYVAATANTINTADSTAMASYSVCPAGWRLPNHNEISSAASNMAAFSPVAGGYYYGGTLYVTGYGYWWSNDANGATRRWFLHYNSSYLYTDYGSRYFGFYVRCVRS